LTLHGPLNKRWVGHINEISARELLVITPLMVMMLWIGVWPAWILDLINKANMMLFG
jgi:NADH-quinone oxidoreductase subunit M